MCLKHRWYIFQRLLENSSLYLRWDLYIWRWNRRKDINLMLIFWIQFYWRIWQSLCTETPFGWTVSLMRNVDGRLLIVPIPRTIYSDPIFYSKVIITLFVPNLIILLFQFITRVVKILFSFFLSSTKMSRFCAIKLKRANFMCPCDLLDNCSN